MRSWNTCVVSLNKIVNPRIKSLLFAIAVLAIFLASVVNGGRVQSRAVKAIEKQRFRVTYNFQYHNGRYINSSDVADYTSSDQTVGWFANLLGVDCFHDVTKVCVFLIFVEDHNSIDLEPIESFKQLEVLNLMACLVAGRELVHLKGLKKLRKLYLHDAIMTDSDLVHLYGLTTLKSLILPKKGISDAALAKLRKALPATEILRLGDKFPGGPSA